MQSVPFLDITGFRPSSTVWEWLQFTQVSFHFYFNISVLEDNGAETLSQIEAKGTQNGQNQFYTS